MTLKEFIKVYNGMGIDYDKAYGFQCMDLFHYFELDVLGIDQDNLLRASTAYQAFLKGADHFDRTYYKPGLLPQPGDVMFWDLGAGDYGHVAICINANKKGFTSFDQNWPVGSKCHEQWHDYRNVAGWLRYNQLTKDQMEDLEKRVEDLENWRETYFKDQVKKDKKQDSYVAKLKKKIKKLKKRKLSKKKAKKTYKTKK